MTEQLLNLDPSDIHVSDNIRFSLKPYRTDRLAETILADGGVRSPIEVSKLDTPIDGKHYRLETGHYRTAAVEKLNKEQSAGLSVPARVVPTLSETERTLRQISENNERENLSPMDKAIAIQRLLANGVNKVDVRKAFAAPGGRKGLKIQAVSNSHINMLLSFLDFPKDIQRRIHEGFIGMGGAYELTKHDKADWDKILDRLEKDRIKTLDAEDREEERYLKTEKEATEKAAEAGKAEKELAGVKETAEKSAQAVKEKEEELSKAFLATRQKGLSPEDKKKAQEHFKAAQAEVKSAEDAASKARKELEKVEDRRKSAADKADAARKRLEEARKVKASKAGQTTSTEQGGAKAKVGAKDVRKAAAETGAKPAKVTPLNASEMKECVKSLVILSKPLNKYQKTAALGTLLEQAFNRQITDGQLHVGVAKLFGEGK